MQLDRREPEDVEVNLTSLIDVVFLLLIFFMVSTTFERQTAVRVDLPSADRESVQAPAERIEIVVTAEGAMFLNDRALVDARRTTIEAALLEAADDERRIPVLIRADGDARHELVVRVMDVLGNTGFSNLSIAAVAESGSSGDSDSG